MAAAKRRNSWETRCNAPGRMSVVHGIAALLLIAGGIVAVVASPVDVALLFRFGIGAVAMGATGALAIVAIVLAAVGLAREPKKPAIVGLILGVAAAVALLASWPLVLTPGLDRARKLDRRAVSAANLNGIGKALVLYGGTENGARPQTLRPLVAEGFVGEKGLFYPGRAGDARAAYVYLPPVGGDPKDTIIACEQIGCSEGGRNFLTSDGVVHWVAEDEFQAELAKPQNARFGEALRKAE